MRKIIVFGKNGQVATELRQLDWGDFEIIAIGSSELDISKSEDFEPFMDQFKSADFFINAAAYTAVDKAEEEAESAFAVNSIGAENIAILAAELNVPLVHISTDYVFDGSKSVAYSEDAPVSPLGVYGESKLDGEERVRLAHDRHIILRTAWVYSPYGHNFVKTMKRLGQERDALSIVEDQRGCPTSAHSIAKACQAVVSKVLNDIDNEALYGVFHYVDEGQTSWFDFALQIFELLAEKGCKVPSTINPIPTSAYPTAAKRPQNSALSIEKFLSVYGAKPNNWEENLRACLNQLYEQDQSFVKKAV